MSVLLIPSWLSVKLTYPSDTLADDLGRSKSRDYRLRGTWLHFVAISTHPQGLRISRQTCSYCTSIIPKDRKRLRFGGAVLFSSPEKSPAPHYTNRYRRHPLTRTKPPLGFGYTGFCSSVQRPRVRTPRSPAGPKRTSPLTSYTRVHEIND